MTEETAALLPEKIEIGEYTARVFKPVALIKCRCSGDTGHRQNDDAYPALVLRDMMRHIIPFRGSRHQFSNLYKCPEGCVLRDGELSFDTSEQMY